MKRTLLYETVCCLLLASLILFPAWAEGEPDPEPDPPLAAPSVPQLINYQGMLTDAQGAPVATGEYGISVAIFAQVSGGEPVWGPQLFPEVPVVRGHFNIILGPKDDAADRDIASAFVGPEAYLEITLGEEAPIAPRQRILSAPYAMNAEHAERASMADCLVPQKDMALNPTGAVLPYAGSIQATNDLIEPVPGYLLCNGAVIDATAENGKYAALKEVLQTSWGNGNDSNSDTVNLPDLRGVFIRGVTGSAGDRFIDPGSTSRESRKIGGNSSNNVGSFQMDAFKSHLHGTNGPGVRRDEPYYPVRTTDDGIDIGGRGNVPRNSDGSYSTRFYPNTRPTGSAETVPKNAYVNFIIKY